jgi:hypothetical protein
MSLVRGCEGGGGQSLSGSMGKVVHTLTQENGLDRETPCLLSYLT